MIRPATGKRRARRFVLLVLFTAAVALAAYAAMQIYQRMRPQPASPAPRELWQINAVQPFQPLALPSGESIVVLGPPGPPQVVALDRAAKHLWRDALPAESAGSSRSTRGLLVYAESYVRYYESSGLLWQWKPDLPVASAFATMDGGALVVLKVPRPSNDPRSGPFHERLTYIDPKGKKVWDKTLPGAGLLWATSSADGETLLALWLVLGEALDARLSLYARNGAVTHESQGAGSLVSKAAMSLTGDLTAVSFAGRVAGGGAQGRWTFQTQGDVRDLAIDNNRQTLILARPRAKYPIFDLFLGHYLITLSPAGQKIAETRVPQGSYGLWIDPWSGTRLVATPDGLHAYDTAGTKLWHLRTVSQVRAVAFFPDGFLAAQSSGSLARYVR